jgi:hypothetical protein
MKLKLQVQGFAPKMQRGAERGTWNFEPKEYETS